MENTFNLIPIVNAQDLDSLAQPTFGNIAVGSQTGSIASVLLSSTSTSTQVGQKFKVTLEIKTNEQQINEYKLAIDFDPAKLTVVDQDSVTAGTQVKLLDTVFTVATPQTNNTVSTTGRITLIANTPSGNGFSVNKNVAEIEFQAQTIGAASIKIAQGSTGTQLTRTNGTALNYTPNELSIQISAQSTTGNTNTGNTGGNTNTGNTGNTNTNTGTTGNTNVPTTIPNTGLMDDLPYLPLAVGVVMVGIGVSLIKGRPTKSSLES